MKNSRLSAALSLALALSLAAVPAHSKSFLDSINEALDGASKAVDKAATDVNKALDSVNDGLRSANGGNGSGAPGIATPPIVNNGNGGNNDISKAVDSIERSVNGVIKDADSTVKKTTGEVNKALDKVNKTIGDINKILGKGNTTNGGGTPPIVDNGKINLPNAGNAGNKINETIDKIKGIFNPGQNNNGGNAITVKALEILAMTGDQWAKLKLAELNTKKKAEELDAKYKSISWFNLISKLKAMSEAKDAKKEYAKALESVQNFEKTNPGSAKLIKGIDQVNESILQVKAMFGDKKAVAQLEMIRAKKEFEAFQAKYDAAGFFERFKLKKELTFLKTRYEKAVEAFNAAGGAVKEAVVANGNVPKPAINANQNPGRIVENPQGQGNNGNIPAVDNTVKKVNEVVDQVQGIFKGVEGDAKQLKEQAEAAYKKLVQELGKGPQNPQVLENLQNEYKQALDKYKKAIGQ